MKPHIYICRCCGLWRVDGQFQDSSRTLADAWSGYAFWMSTAGVTVPAYRGPRK